MPPHSPSSPTGVAAAAWQAIRLHTRSLKVMPLSAKLAQQLPVPRHSRWSAFEAVTKGIGQPVVLSALRKQVNTTALRYAQSRTHIDGLSAAQVVRVFAADTFEWHDTERFVMSYHDLVDSPGSPVVYTRAVDLQPPVSAFPLREWWAVHLPSCTICTQHDHAHGGFDKAMKHNADNPCVFADILSWLSGQWRIPFNSIPPPGARANYESLLYAPDLMQEEIDRMKEWSVIVPGKPHLIHPVMAVIRDSDLHDACRILHAIGQPSPSEEKREIQAINAHISTVLSSGASVPSHLGQLKPVKIRFCVDASLLLNPFIKKWRFPYASIHDAVSLLHQGWFMARIDLKRFFQQLPLNEQDWPMLGLRLPKDLRHLAEEVETWVSAFAHFGGSPFPAYANGIMSALSGLLRAHNIPNVFITDDVFVCGATKAECQARLEQAVALLVRLGWILQEDKLLGPSQELPFVGIFIDTINERLSIPTDKLDNYLRSIRRVLEDDAAGQLLAKDLESLIGKLSWVVEVMIAGKAHLWPLRQALPHGWYHHRRLRATVRLGQETKAALQWWERYIQHALHHPFWVPFWTHSAPLFCRTFSDSSGEVGFGLALGQEVFQGLWEPATIPHSSGFKELIPILLVVCRLGPESRGKIVVVTTDNLGNVIAINKGSCRSPQSYQILGLIMELAAEKQIYLIADWSPREEIDCMDAISKEPWGDDIPSLF